MSVKNYIQVEEYCRYYSIESSFIKTLNDEGLIELHQQEEIFMIGDDQLPLLEKYIHFHYDMDINIEGIEAISYLLEKITYLQSELRKHSAENI